MRDDGAAVEGDGDAGGAAGGIDGDGFGVADDQIELFSGGIQSDCRNLDGGDGGGDGVDVD